MRSRFQILLLVAYVLLPATITPAFTEESHARSRVNKLSFVLERSKGSPQTTSRKRRSAKNRRRASTPQGSKPTLSQATTQPSTAAASPSTSQGPLSQVTYELPLRKPGVGEQRAQGLLTDVACDARGVTFKITVGDRVLKLWTPDLNKIHFATYTPDVSGEITCGVRRTPNRVVVVFRPSKTPTAKSDGTPVSVEFVPKNFK